MKPFYASFVLVLLLSCGKNSDSIQLRGIYYEQSPVSGRSSLNFLNDHIVIKSETGSTVEDTFYYQTRDSSITLTPAWTAQPGITSEFRILDWHSFQIGNLYPSIPEAPALLMIFKK